MALKSNRAFTLLEVLITTAILSTAIIFVFRSFATSLAAAKFSQNMSLACYLAEDKIAQIEEKQKESNEPVGSEQGREELPGREFSWNYKTAKSEDSDLIKLEFNILWPENTREKEYKITFVTDLLPQGKMSK